ncbi:O-antigen ligase family protein [Pyxidicoccus sp. 3LFB2]
MNDSLPPVALAADSSRQQGARAVIAGLATLFLFIVAGFVWSFGQYWLLAVFLIMVVLSHQDLRRFFFVLAFFIPFLQGGARPELYIVAPTLEVVLLAFFLLWFLDAARGRTVSLELSPRDIPWLPFFSVAAGSAVAACAARLQSTGFSTDKFDLLAILFHDPMIGPFYPARALFSFLEVFLLFQFVRSNLDLKGIETLMRTLLGSACLVNLVGLVGYFTDDLTGYFHGVNRATSLFSGPNQFATCLLMSLPLSAALLVAARERLSRWLAVLCLMTGLPALYLTRSQGAWLAVAAVPLLLLLFLPEAKSASIRRWKWLAVPVLGLVALATGGYVVATRTPEQINALTDGRYFLFLAGFEMVKASPILGVGLGNFYQLLGGFYPDDIVGRAQHEHAHNMYLQIVAELGLLGLVLLLWPLGTLLRRALSGALLQGPTPIGLLAAVLGTLIHSLTDYTLLIIPVALLLAIELGMLAVLMNHSHRN